MFREGYYLEVIKAKYSAATAVITIKEKTIDIKSKKNIKTNKWMTIEDWSSLYDILERALLLQNSNNNGSNGEEKTRSTSSIEKKKFTRHLEITYTFEDSENPTDRTCLPTMRVAVSSIAKKGKEKVEEKEKSRGREREKEKEKKRKKRATEDHLHPNKKSKKNTAANHNNNNNEDGAANKDKDEKNGRRKKKTNDLTSNAETYYDAEEERKKRGEFKVEEYIPGATPFTNGRNKNMKKDDKANEDVDDDRLLKITETYVPSRKSTLEYLQKLQSCSNTNSDEYVPSNIIPKDETMKIVGGTEMLGANGSALDDLYIPNSVPKSSEYDLLLSETYEPSSLSVGGIGDKKYTERAEEYIPNSKTSCLKKEIVDEYQPDFIVNKNNDNKIMKFDESYIPSSTKKIKELIKKKKKYNNNNNNNNHHDGVSKSSRKKNKIAIFDNVDRTEKIINFKEDAYRSVDTDNINNFSSSSSASLVGHQNDIGKREM